MVIFGGLHLDVAEVKLICDEPHWEGIPEPDRGRWNVLTGTWEVNDPTRDIVPQNIDSVKARAGSTLLHTLEFGPIMSCEERHAVCGLATKYREDGSGIQEVNVVCCAFPF